MDNQHPLTPEGFRTAAYLAARERLDLKGKLKCNPPNRACGDRCIPPTWKCRVKGEGTDSHSRVVAGDPLAGAASIARGRARLAQGLRTGNVTDIQAGRAAIARGVVKAVPGQNLKEKQDLRKRVEAAILPIATGLFAAWALRQGHEGAKVLFPAYAKGPARDLENAAGSAIGFVFDRIPVYGAYRQAQRANAEKQAQVLARAVRIGINKNPEITTNNSQAFVELSRQKISGLRTAISAGLKVTEPNQGEEESPEGGVTAQPNKKARETGYPSYRSQLLSGVLGARDSTGRSVYAEPAAINLLAKQYGIKPDSIIGADNTARKSFLISAVSTRLSSAAESMRADMAVRGLDHRKPEDVETYTDIASRNAEKRFQYLNPAQRKEALSGLKGTVRELVSPSKAPQPTRSLASRLYNDAVTSYNDYFVQAAQRVKEDTDPKLRVHVASAADSPVRAALIGVAERVKGRVGINAPIAGANHAELVLQRVFHEYSVPNGYKRTRKATWAPTDSDVKYAAQDLGWDGQGGVSAAYGVLERSGQFPNLARRPADVVKPATAASPPGTERQRPPRRRPKTTAERVAAYIKAGYSEEAARRKVAEIEANLKSDSYDEIPQRVQSYLQRKSAWKS